MLLERDAKRLGIDLSKIDKSDYKKPPKAESFPLYNLTNRLSRRIKNLIKDLQVIPIDADESLIKENIDILLYYHHLISVKIYRAFTSRIEEEKDEDDFTFDSKTSTFIAANGLLNTGQALNGLATHKPLHLVKARLLKLANLSLNLAESIDLEFELGAC